MAKTHQLCIANPTTGMITHIANETGFAAKLTRTTAKQAFFGLAVVLSRIKTVAEAENIEIQVDKQLTYEVESVIYSLQWFENLMKNKKWWDKDCNRTKQELNYGVLLDV